MQIVVAAIEVTALVAPGRGGKSPGDWIAFWDSEHSIYVNPRHREVHCQRVAQDIRAHVPIGARVLDYGCGEALHADLVAKTAHALTLCEAAPMVRAALARRFATHPRIRVCSPTEVLALPSGSFDVIVMHSVAQYLGTRELDELLVVFQTLLQPGGLLVIGDLLPPHVSAATDALALLRFAAKNGFFWTALAGLLRTLVSDYWRLRSRLGLTRYSDFAITQKLATAGFSATRARVNIGHNPARATWLARRL